MPANLDVSCPTDYPDTTKRAEFGRTGVTLFGWPSTGGVLIKDAANIVDLTYLDVDRLHASQRAATDVEEDAFCEKLRISGAKWWENEQSDVDVLVGARDPTASEARETIFAWPKNGGVWVLSFPTQGAIPKDLGRVNMAFDMDERAEVMKEYGARFFDDAELATGYWKPDQDGQ